MTVDPEQDCIGGHRAEIVEQQAHAHAAVGCAEQTFEQNFADQILVPDEILHIEAALRRIRQDQSRSDGVVRVRERVKPRLPRMRRHARPHHHRQRGALVAFHRRGSSVFGALGKTTARGERNYCQ